MDIPQNIQTFFDTILSAARQQGAEVFLWDKFLLALLNKCPLPSELNFIIKHDSFNVPLFYTSLTKNIIINREIEHTDTVWRVVSNEFIFDFRILSKSAFAEYANNAILSTDLLLYDISTNVNILFDHKLRILVDRKNWDVSHILKFATIFGYIKEPIIETDFSGVSLYGIGESKYERLSDSLSRLILTRSPGIALRFVIDSFPDGSKWLTEKFLALAQSLNIPIDEDITSNDLIGNKKLELLDIYGQFFESDSTQQTIAKTTNQLNTILRLMFNSPNVNVQLPYIESVVIVTAKSPAPNAAFTKSTSFSHPLPPYIDLCDPLRCGEQNPSMPCCCCLPQSTVSQAALRCHEKVIASCNKDGSGPGPGLEPAFPAQCDLCRSVCGGILTGSLLCENLPSQTWWHYNGAGDMVCRCECMAYAGPGAGEGPCLLTCAKCGMICASEFEIYPSSAGDCQFQAKARPSQGCCGNPGLIDVMFVIDISSDITTEIKDGIYALVDKATAQGTEFRFGITTFGHLVAGEGSTDPSAVIDLNFTKDVELFRQTLNGIVPGSGLPYDFDAIQYAVNYGEWLSTDKYVLFFGDRPSSDDPYLNFSNTTLQTTIDLCHNNKIVFYAIDANSTQRPILATQTGGYKIDIDTSFTDVVDSLKITAFPTACECLTNDYIYILYSASGNVEQKCVDSATGLPIVDSQTGLPPERCTSIPIHICNVGDDCTNTCELEHNLWACGNSITINPLSVSMVCCSEVGYGCQCRPEAPQGYCCGPTANCDPVCDPVTGFPLYNSLEEAQEAIWCKCFDKAAARIPDTCHNCCCPDTNLPIGHRWYPCYALENVLPGDPLYTQAQELLQNQQCCNTPESDADDCCHLCVLVNDGEGGTTQYCKEQLDLEVANAFGNCHRREVPDFACDEEKLNDIDCIVSKIDSTSPCTEPRAGIGSVLHPATTILNNGIGLIAYEVHEDEQAYSNIRVEQFKTSVLAKLLPNRVFNFGRLEHSSKWIAQGNGTQTAKLYYYNDMPSRDVEVDVSVAMDSAAYIIDSSDSYSELFILNNNVARSMTHVDRCPAEFSALAYGPDKVLYAVDFRFNFPHRLWKMTSLNPLRFECLGDITNLSSPTLHLYEIVGIAFDPDDADKLWFVRHTRVGYIKISTLVAYDWVDVISGSPLKGVAFDTNKTMFVGVLNDTTSTSLAIYDRVSKATTPFTTSNSFTLITLYTVGGNLYGVGWPNEIYTFNKTTGTATFLMDVDPIPRGIHGMVAYNESGGANDQTENKDIVSFKNGPLRGLCFPLRVESDGSVLGTDSVGNFIPFSVPQGLSLPEPFATGDDVYNIEWFLMNKNDTGLIGDAVDTTSVAKEYDIATSTVVSNALKSIIHKHNGNPVPVAHPSIACAKNYMNTNENSHYVYMAYQALEDGKWNVYLRQIRLSEYDRQKQFTDVNPVNLLNIQDNFEELVYRIVCTEDTITEVGSDVVASRTAVIEVLTKDGREVLTRLTSGNWGKLCGDYPPESFPKNKVYGRVTHSAVTTGVPDIFDLDEIFYPWMVGEEYVCSLDVISQDQVFNCMKKSGSTSVPIGVYDVPIEVGKVFVKSAYASVLWYQDMTIDGWYVMTNDSYSTLGDFKGFDICEPILISDNTEHCMKPVVGVNYNNDVFVAYEKSVSGIPVIEVCATTEPGSSLPGGVIRQKNPDENLSHFLSPNEFTYRLVIANRGMNQHPSMYIDKNDNIHVAWQSNRDGDWEIYYANADASFQNVRITKAAGKSLKPRIEGDDEGNLFIVWSDNRTGNYEIMLAYNIGQRILPYSQQDPYWAGLRNNYTHHEDTIPLFLTNTTESAICLTDLSVTFYYDRGLSSRAFSILYSEAPFAFTFSNVPNITGTQTNVFDNLDAWQVISDSEVKIINGTEFDTTIPSAQVYRLKVDGTCSVSVSLRSSNDPVDPTSESQWTDWAVIEPGVWYTYASLGLDDSIGQYKQVRISYDTSCTTPTEFSIETYCAFSLCIESNETVTATLNLTPEMKVTAYGSQTAEVPLAKLFVQNNTYFVLPVGTTTDDETYYFEDQHETVSCYSCVRSQQDYDTASCTVLLSYTNETTESQAVDFEAVFYIDKQATAEAMTLKTSDTTSGYFSMENGNAITDYRLDNGFSVLPGQTLSLLLSPPISATDSINEALNCNITYAVIVTAISDAGSSVVVNKLWKCDCNSPRWGQNVVQLLDSLDRWNSSGAGYSDVRITETRSNNLNPVLRMKSNGHGIVLYETDRVSHTSEKSKEFNEIYASVFKFIPDSDTFATGAQAIVPPLTGSIARTDIKMSVPDKQSLIAGNNVDFSLDQYDNMFIAVEEPGSPLLENPVPTGPVNMDAFQRQRFIKIYRLDWENLSFDTGFVDPTTPGAGTTTPPEADTCISRVTCYYYQENPDIADIVKQIRIDNDYVRYHITRLNREVPVIKNCKVVFTIVGTPETVAVRMKNLVEDAWSEWIAFDSEIDQNTIRVPWTLTKGNGIKNVYMQFATYAGLASGITYELIADYEQLTYSIYMYKPMPGVTPTDANFHNEAIFSESNRTKLFQAFPVASLESVDASGNQPDYSYVFIEIVPDQDMSSDVTFDLIQQGTQDLFGQLTTKVGNKYRAAILVHREDVVSYKDGLAAIIPHFADDCYLIESQPPIVEDAGTIQTHVIPDAGANPDFNIPVAKTTVTPVSVVPDTPVQPLEDPWMAERDQFGLIQYRVAIRPDEDPHFVFGDPDYRLEKQDE